MNYGISVLFRTIPLLMALFCFGYGAFVLDMGTDPAKNVAGPVVMSLGMICIALFATAATIIRQIIHTYNTVVRYALPVLGYLAALLTFICGWEYISEAATASHFVAGHVICGVAFITACVATTATSSTRFTLIPANSQTTENNVLPQAFNGTQGKLLIVVAALLALATWIWTFLLLAKSDVHNAYYVAGHVMAGIACICTSLVALVATIVRQIRNSYSHAERKWWPVMVLAMGTFSILWGLLILKNPNPAESSIGYIMIGLGLVCYSISSKVILLAAIWRNTFKLANRIPLIPVFTALLCLFLSAFLFEWQAYTKSTLYRHVYWQDWAVSASHSSPS